jgi:transcriptional regulator with XRE-family HTH domain
MTDLDAEVKELLEQRRGDWKRIAEEADVSHSWISQFVRNLIPNPGYATLKKLHARLAEHEANQRAV